MLYYSNGGPGPATKLLRIDASPAGDYKDWLRAPASRWTVTAGWFPIIHAHLDIQHLGEFFLIDPDDVPTVQQQMNAAWERAGHGIAPDEADTDER